MTPLQNKLFLRTLCSLAMTAFIAALSPLSLHAAEILDSLDAWHMYGEHGVNYDYYDVRGDVAPETRYPFPRNQVYGQFRQGFDRRFSDYESLRFSASGLLNGSEYRSPEHGWIFEDARVNWEKGDGFVPFRLSAGDFTADFSYRTIQQTLKGLQIEIQPNLKIGSAEQRHSIVAFTGMRESDWRDVDYNRDLYNGLSWVMDFARFGALGMHWVHNYRDHNGLYDFVDQHQVTGSMTYEKVQKLWTEEIRIEGEYAGFYGDYQPQTNPTVRQADKDDTGGYFQLNGDSDTPLSYGFRYEGYGDHYQPHGAVITTNRRTLAWKSGWEFQPGLHLDGRVEAYRDNLESFNRQETRLYGLSFAGPLQNPWLRDLNVYTDFFDQSIYDVEHFVFVQTQSYKTDLSAKVYKEWTGYTGFSGVRTHDKAFEPVIISREYTLGAGHPVSAAGIQGSFRSGLVLRHTTGITANNQFGGNFSASLYKGIQSLNVTSQALYEDGRRDFAQDVVTLSCGGNYSLTFGPHRFGLNLDISNRNPTEFVKHTQDTRFGLSYTFSFDKPAGVDVRDFSWTKGYPAAGTILENVRFESKLQDPIFLDKIAPGLSPAEVEAYFANKGVKSAAQGSLQVYEARLFSFTDQRQRTAVQTENGVVSKSVFIMNLNPALGPSEAEQIFQDVKNTLAARFGNPTFEDSNGKFTSNFREEINNGTLVRVAEWKSESGIIRLGIPKRLDKQIRIELHFAQSLPPSQSSFWSLEELV